MLTVCSQQRLLRSSRVNVAAARCAVHVTITSVSVAITITSCLVDDSRHHCLSCALHLSKDEHSICGIDWPDLWYMHVDTSEADLFPLIGGLGCGRFVCMR